MIRRVTAQGQGAELEIDGARALEDFREQSRDHKRNDESEKDIVRNHPPAGRQARQAAIETHNRYLDQADRHPEDDYATKSKLMRARHDQPHCSFITANVQSSFLTKKKRLQTL